MIETDEKIDNLYSLVAEYEQVQNNIANNHHMKRYFELRSMLCLAFDRFEYAEEKQKHHNLAMKEYARLYYDNLNAKTVRDYAMVYDKENIEKYPAAKPLSSLDNFVKSTGVYVSSPQCFYNRYVRGAR